VHAVEMLVGCADVGSTLSFHTVWLHDAGALSVLRHAFCDTFSQMQCSSHPGQPDLA